MKLSAILLLSFSLLSALSAKKISPISSIYLSNQSRNRSSLKSPIRGFVKLRVGSTTSALENIGVKIESENGTILTVSVPPSSLKKFLSLPDILSFSTGKKSDLVLDSARYFSDAENLHISQSPTAVTGKGVIVGVVDVGFQYIHPAFTDNKGECRIVRVWDQNDSSGATPDGYSYGSELRTSSEILSKEHCSVALSTTHGTHVAAIAAGRKVVDSLDFAGVASEAELVFVSSTLLDSDIYDGVSYIFNYAQSVGKPAVINLSLSSAAGSHDGTSPIEQGYLELSKQGAVIVNAAGNSGGMKQHIQHDFVGIDSIKTFCGDVAMGMKLLDFWGEEGFDFSLKAEIIRKSDSTIVATIPTLNLGNEVFDTVFSIGDESDLQVTTATEPNTLSNGKSEAAILFNDSSDSYFENYEILLTITSKESGRLHGWNSAYYSFESRGKVGFIDGDTSYTVGDGGSGSAGVVTVGAFKSRAAVTNLVGDSVELHPYDSGGVEELAWFSSCGPTVDGRVKPEITAPGVEVISAFNSYAETIEPITTTHKFSYNRKEYYYGTFGGTSMSSPFAAGAIACLLEVDSSLTLDEILEILKESAVVDNFTGAIPNGGSNSWGFGKLSVQKAIDKTVEFLEYKKEYQKRMDNFYLTAHKDGSKVDFIFSHSLPAGAKLNFWDAKGRLVFQTQIDSDGATSVTTSSLSAGIYVYRMSLSSKTGDFHGEFESSSDGKVLVY
jgi:minor extracellular serine protease Vpr